MAKYTSGRQKNLKIGISSYSENLTSLEVIGKVGIGTTNAITQLHLSGFSTTNSNLKIGSLEFQNYSLNNSFFGDNVYWNGSAMVRRSTGASGLFYFFGDEGQFRLSPVGLAGSETVNSPQLKINSNGGFGIGSSLSQTANNFTGANFYVNPQGVVLVGTISSTGTASQRLQVNSGAYVSGNVGIGTTSPQAKLDVVGDIKISGVSTLGAVTISSGIITAVGLGTVVYYGDGSNLQGVNAFNVINQDINSTPVFPTFASNTGVSSVGISTTKLVFIPTSGNLGIGTTSPQAKLHVVGDGLFTGVVTATTFIGALTGTATTATNLKNGLAGNVVYQSAADTTAFLTNGDSGTILQSNGVGNAPTWVTPAADAITGLTIRDENNIVSGLNSVSALNFVGSIVSVASTAGIATITFLDYVSNAGIATYADNAGIATYATNAGVSTYATVAGIATYATNAGISTYADNAGIATYATNAGIATYADNAGIATSVIGGIASVTQLNVSGISTFTSGPVFIGAAISTGTALQRLQVTDGAYVSGSVGIGTTNPTSKLQVQGDVSVVGIVTATQFSTGASGTGVNISTDTISGPSLLYIDPAAVGDNTGAVRIKGDLYVDGTQFIVNSTTIEFADFNVGIATTVGTNALLDGAGIGIGSTGIRKTLTWSNSSTSLKSSEDFDVASGKVYKINGTSVLSNTTLGSDVTNSSLTSVGTLGQLQVTGVSTFTNGPILVGTATSTGTASQPLQVTGGAYVSGNLGIGTTNPGATLNVVPTATSIAGLFSGTTSSDMVRITQLGSGNALVVEDSVNPDSSPFVVRGDGSVGIGTTNPTATLTVAGNSANILIGKQYATANTITLNGSTATADYNILSTSANNLFINRPSGKFIAFAQADSSHANFDTSNNFILNSGNLGIGDFTPTYALDAGAASRNKAGRVGSIIFGTAGVSYGIIGYNAKPSALNAWTYDVTDVASWIQFLSGGHVFYRAASGTAGFFITPLESGRFDSSGNLLIGTATSTGTASQKLQVGSASTPGGAYVSGSVGIGTTNPTSKLHVVGDARVTGVVTATSFVKTGGTSSQFLKADGSVDDNNYTTDVIGISYAISSNMFMP